MKTADLVTLETFRSVADAQVAQGILDEVGIDSMIHSDNAGGLYPAIDAARLMVRAEDAATAQDALRRRHRKA
jgi:hypothetical protein